VGLCDNCYSVLLSTLSADVAMKNLVLLRIRLNPFQCDGDFIAELLADNFELCVVGLDHVRSTLDHMQETRYLHARQRLAH